MARYLVDTNHLSAALKPVSPVRQQIYQMHGLGHRFGICVPVLCELEAGIAGLLRKNQPRQILSQLSKDVRLWPIGRDTARRYGEIHIELRKAGRVLSQVDMMIAALAREMSLTVLSGDRDFEALPGIKTESWL